MYLAACSTCRVRRALAALVASLLLAGCATLPPPRAAEETRPPDLEAPSLPPRGARAYGIVPGDSELRLLVHRAGELAKFGHNHVIISAGVHGKVYRGETAATSAFELTIPVESFQVDPAAARAEEGEAFSSNVSKGAAKGTRDNMLGDKVLDAEHYPDIRVRSVAMTGPMWNPDARMRITLHGVTRDLTAPFSVTEAGNRLVIVGSFSLKQSDFGITPFSALNGGLQVQDIIRVRARIVAEPTESR